MKNKILFIIPALLLADFLLLSFITDLVRQKSDIAVLVGIILLFSAGYGNYFLIKYINKNNKAK